MLLGVKWQNEQWTKKWNGMKWKARGNTRSWSDFRYPVICVEGRGKLKKPPVRTAVLRVEIWTWDLQNSMKWAYSTSMFDGFTIAEVINDRGLRYGLYERKTLVQLLPWAPRPTLGPTQPPSQFMNRRPSFTASGMKVTTNFHLIPKLKKDWSFPPHEDKRFTVSFTTV